MTKKTKLSILCAVIFFHMLGWNAEAPLVPLYASDLGATPFVVGLVVGSWGVLPVVFGIPVGVSCDRYGLKRVMVAGALGMLGGIAMLCLSADVAMVAASQAVQGLAQVALVTSVLTYVSRLGDPDDSAASFGTLTAVASVGLFIGPPLGGALTDLYGYRAAFLAVALSLLAQTAFTALLPVRPPRGGGPGGRLELKRILGVGARPGVASSLIAGFFLMMLMALRRSFFPLYLSDLGYSASIIGALLSAQAAAAVLVRMSLPAIMRYAGAFVILVLSAALAAASTAGIPLLASLASLAMVCVVFGAGHGLMMPISMVLVTEATSEGERGLAMGMRQTVHRLADLVGPVTLGACASAIGMASAFYVGGAAMATATAVLFAVKPSRGAQAPPGAVDRHSLT